MPNVTRTKTRREGIVEVSNAVSLLYFLKVETDLSSARNNARNSNTPQSTG